MSVAITSAALFSMLACGLCLTRTSRMREGMIEGMRNYMNNPDELANRLERATENGTRSQYPTYAYEAGPVADAQKIKWNLNSALVGKEKASTTEIRTQIESMLNQASLEGINQSRVHSMLDTNMNEVALCWNYIVLDKTRNLSVEENKSGFIQYLSQTEGCPHGRGPQILLYFQGVDKKIAPIKETNKLKTVPPENTDHRLEMVAQINTALTHEQTSGTLEIDASKETAKKLISPFFTKNKKNSESTEFQQMIPKVFTELFDEVWRGLDAA